MQNSRARLTGTIYLAFFLTAILGAFLTSTGHFAHGRSGLVMYGSLVSEFSNACYLAVGYLFYRMFKPVSHGISLLAACCNVAGCVTGSLTLFQVISPRVNALYFFGPYCLLLGYLIFRSTFLPKAIGVLMMLAGLAWLMELIPPLAKPIFPVVAVLGIVAEAALMFWLLIKGVHEERWKQMQATHTS